MCLCVAEEKKSHAQPSGGVLCPPCIRPTPPLLNKFIKVVVVVRSRALLGFLGGLLALAQPREEALRDGHERHGLALREQVRLLPRQDGLLRDGLPIEQRAQDLLQQF